MRKKGKLSFLRTNLIRLVARGHIYDIKFVALAFGFADPYDGDDGEIDVTPKMQEKLLEEILTVTEEDIEYVCSYLRDEAYIDI